MAINLKALLPILLRLTTLSFLIAQFFMNAYAGNLTASVDRDTIGLEETFTLTLRYDEQINASPDYELLRRDFDILNTQSGTQMTIVNGVTEAYTEWRVALAPKRIGKVLIPSFNIDGAISDAIEITIEGKSRSPKNGSSNVSVELETDKDSAHVQEQIIITVRLYTSVALSGVNLEPLNIKDALIVQLDEKQYQTNINGRPHVVAETRFALYPQQSGELIIPSLLYQVSVDNGQGSMWNRLYGNNSNNILRLRTDEQHITVLPTPDEVKGKTWLPAKDISITEHWSAGIDTLKVGEPITRSLSIKADGLTSGQLTPLNLPPVDGLTFYEDQAQTDEQKSEKGIVATRTETLAIIPNRAGTFTLPEVKLRWWDTDEKIFKTATIESETLNVTGGTLTTTPSATNTNDTSESVDINTDLSTISKPETVTVEKIPLWMYISNVVTLISTLLFALLYWKNKRELAAIYTTDNIEQQEFAINERQAWDQVKHSLSAKELKSLRTALINWAQVHCRNSGIINLQILSETIGQNALTEQLNKLDAAIYSGKTDDFDTHALLEIIGNLRRQKNTSTASDKLQPLYKNH